MVWGSNLGLFEAARMGRLGERRLEKARRKKKAEKLSRFECLKETWREFMLSTTIHGMRYLVIRY